MDKEKLVKFGLMALVGIAVVVYAKGKAGEAVDAINPFNNENLINKTFSDIYTSMTGSKSGSIGSDIYDFLHDKNGTLKVNPASEDNVIGYTARKGYEWGLDLRNFLTAANPFN